MIEKILKRFGYKKTSYCTPEEIGKYLDVVANEISEREGKNFRCSFVSGYDVFIYGGNRLMKSIRLESYLAGIDNCKKFYDYILHRFYVTE